MIRLLIYAASWNLSATVNGVKYRNPELLQRTVIDCNINCLDPDDEETSKITWIKNLPTTPLLEILSDTARTVLAGAHISLSMRKRLDALLRMCRQEPPRFPSFDMTWMALRRLRALSQRHPEYSSSISVITQAFYERLDTLRSHQSRQSRDTNKTLFFKRIARWIFEILGYKGIYCAVLGGLACWLYGSDREPEVIIR